MIRLALILAVVLGVAACGRAAPLKQPNPQGGCVGFSNNIMTLRVGDELPRVVQVLGMPNNAYRGFTLFGPAYDVLEYKITPSSCYRAMLDSHEQAVRVVFDKHGGYIGTGDSVLKRARGWIPYRQEPLIVDPVVLLP